MAYSNVCSLRKSGQKTIIRLKQPDRKGVCPDDLIPDKMGFETATQMLFDEIRTHEGLFLRGSISCDV
jgi:hypothetical protein